MKNLLLKPVKTFYIAVLKGVSSPFVRVLDLFYRRHRWEKALLNDFKTTKLKDRRHGIDDILKITLPKIVTFFEAILFRCKFVNFNTIVDI